MVVNTILIVCNSSFIIERQYYIHRFHNNSKPRQMLGLQFQFQYTNASSPLKGLFEMVIIYSNHVVLVA